MSHSGSVLSVSGAKHQKPARVTYWSAVSATLRCMSTVSTLTTAQQYRLTSCRSMVNPNLVSIQNSAAKTVLGALHVTERQLVMCLARCGLPTLNSVLHATRKGTKSFTAWDVCGSYLRIATKQICCAVRAATCGSTRAATGCSRTQQCSLVSTRRSCMRASVADRSQGLILLIKSST